MTTNSSNRPWYSYVLLVLVFSAVAWFIFNNLDEITRYNFRFKYSHLILCFLFVNAAYIAIAFIWFRISISCGLNASLLKACEAWFLSLLGKYVPGKVTLFLVRFDAYRKYSKRKVAVAISIEQISSMAAGSILFLVALTSSVQIVPYYIKWVSCIGAVLFLLLLWPPIFMSLINHGLKFLKREPIKEFPPYGVLIRFVFAYIFAGLLQGMGFYFVLNSYSPVDFRYFLIIAGIYEAASLVGLAAVFAPSGIGVREGILFICLSSFIPKPAVIVGAITIRLITTAAELLLAGFFLAAYKIRTNRSVRPIQHP